MSLSSSSAPPAIASLLQDLNAAIQRAAELSDHVCEFADILKSYSETQLAEVSESSPLHCLAFEIVAALRNLMQTFDRLAKPPPPLEFSDNSEIVAFLYAHPDKHRSPEHLELCAKVRAERGARRRACGARRSRRLCSRA